MNLYNVVKSGKMIDEYIDFGFNGDSVEDKVNHLMERTKYNTILHTIDMLAGAKEINELDGTLLRIDYTQSITLEMLCNRYGWILK